MIIPSLSIITDRGQAVRGERKWSVDVGNIETDRHTDSRTDGHRYRLKPPSGLSYYGMYRDSRGLITRSHGSAVRPVRDTACFVFGGLSELRSTQTSYSWILQTRTGNYIFSTRFHKAELSQSWWQFLTVWIHHGYWDYYRRLFGDYVFVLIWLTNEDVKFHVKTMNRFWKKLN